ncbi:ABC transporter permease [Pengzhenrongella sicca]|uniref:Polyketide antibiotic transporter n=1 Tax=Pengzhenrongella sicca TaxID=2819238 RepID=A0A8A4ZHR2_9MICO|nr:polyketide antibiotic transporter [Pengzhenrongella sicca]QTE30805.1 polyketide antibiotic transporter [Pengzhenrongella sicca]
MTALDRSPVPVLGAPSRAARSDAFVAAGRLTRFALRRDRTRIAVWALALSGLIAYFAAAIPAAYPEPGMLQARAAIMREPAGAFMAGPGYGLDAYTFGAMVSNELLGLLAVAAALTSASLVVRHTRAEEETGRAELIRAGVVGRFAPLTAALATMVVADVVVAAALFAALAGSGFAATDSLAVALGVALVGLAFGAVAAVTAQLAEHSRAASGLAGAALGLAYVLRGIGDAAGPGGSTLSWLSPIGWAQQTRAFVDLRWWPLALCMALAAAAGVVAFALAGRRDLGAGLVPARRGRAQASRALGSPIGVSARMERAVVGGWAVGIGIFAALTGSLGQGIVDSFADQPQLAEVFGAGGSADVLSATLAAFLSFFAMAVAAYAVTAVNRLRREEDEGRVGALLATAVSRTAWFAGALTVTAAACALLLVVAGMCLGLGAAASVGDPDLTWQLAGASLAYLPIVLCFGALAALAFGLRSGGWAVWALLVASIVVGVYGPLFNLPAGAIDAAPFGLVPLVPSEPFDALPLVLMCAVVAALVTGAAAALRRRDLRA